MKVDEFDEFWNTHCHSDEIPTPGKMYRIIKNSLVDTFRFGKTLNETKGNCGDSENLISNGGFRVHFYVRESTKVAAYFPTDVSKQSIELINERDKLYNECGKNAFLEDSEIQRINFPWLDNLDLSGNIQKILSIEDMAKYKVKMREIHDPVKIIDQRILFAALKELYLRYYNTKIYDRKKTLEENMAEFLENSGLIDKVLVEKGKRFSKLDYIKILGEI